MLKCVVINGSPHKGNTYELAKIVMNRMHECGATIEEIHLGQHKIPFCSGCFSCFERGEDACPHHDAVKPIAQAIESADALIVLTPAYSLAPTALLKNMIDHLSYYFHRPRFFGRKALVLSTTAGAGAKACTGYIRNVLGHWGFGRVYTYALACFAALGYTPSAKAEKRLDHLAGCLVRDIKNGRTPRVRLKRVMYYNAWRAMAAVHPESIDGHYWHDSGLARTAFAPQIKLGLIGRLFGALMFRLIKFSMVKFS